MVVLIHVRLCCCCATILFSGRSLHSCMYYVCNVEAHRGGGSAAVLLVLLLPTMLLRCSVLFVLVRKCAREQAEQCSCKRNSHVTR